MPISFSKGEMPVSFSKREMPVSFSMKEMPVSFSVHISVQVISEYFRRRRVWSSHRQIRKTKVRQETALGRTQAVPGGVGPGSGRLPSSFSWLKFPQPEFGQKRGFPTSESKGESFSSPRNYGLP